ncbi:MAG: hypothetical protein JM58_17255 [Peptococcaceae bacterium BICA1-8]|nr:MAG: hypothetical protein JM58_17255 [Peptococcaceae bacterium BICA1-8]
MAVYEFYCNNCREEFTVHCSMEERTNASCAKCGSQDLRRIFRPVGVKGGSKNHGSVPPRKPGFT